jgi:hypothetical protein
MAFLTRRVRKDSLNWCACVRWGELVTPYELRCLEAVASEPQQFSGILAIAGTLTALWRQR